VYSSIAVTCSVLCRSLFAAWTNNRRERK